MAPLRGGDIGLSRLVGVVGLSWSEAGRLEPSSEPLETSSFDSDFFLLNREKAGTERGRLAESFLARRIGFQILSSKGMGGGEEGRGGDPEDDGSDMWRERSSRCSIMVIMSSLAPLETLFS